MGEVLGSENGSSSWPGEDISFSVDPRTMGCSDIFILRNIGWLELKRGDPDFFQAATMISSMYLLFSIMALQGVLAGAYPTVISFLSFH